MRANSTELFLHLLLGATVLLTALLVALQAYPMPAPQTAPSAKVEAGRTVEFELPEVVVRPTTRT